MNTWYSNPVRLIHFPPQEEHSKSNFLPLKSEQVLTAKSV